MIKIRVANIAIFISLKAIKAIKKMNNLLKNGRLNIFSTLDGISEETYRPPNCIAIVETPLNILFTPIVCNNKSIIIIIL